MKKLFILSVLSGLVMIACSKSETEKKDNTQEVQEEQPVRNPIKFTSEASKVGIDGYALQFDPGDNIAVVSYDYANETTKVCSDYAVFDGKVTSPSGTFTPNEYEYGDNWAGEADALSFYSFYPTSAALAISGTTATVGNITASQDGSLSSIVCWAKGSNIASSDEVKDGKVPSFSYSPVCALLKLNIVNNTPYVATSISNITFTAGSGNIAGNASLDLITGKLTGGNSSTITYEPASSLEIAGEGSATIYLAFIPATVSSWSIALTDSRGATCTFELNKNMPTSLLPGRLYERTLSINSIINVSGSSGTYNGVKFVRGFLKRTDNTSTSQTDMRFSDATVNPFEMIGFARATDDSYNQMYFAISDVNTIFGGTSGSSFESNSLQIGGHNYKVPSKDDFDAITKTATARTSNKPSINGSKKAWALVMVTLTDSESATGTDYKDLGFQSANTAANFLRGMLFFPDNGQVICSHIDDSKCDAITEEIWGDQTNLSPNTITTTQLMALIDNGCLFLPAIGGRSGADDSFVGRGNSGYYWSSTYKQSNRAHLLMFSNGSGSETYYCKITDYGIARKFPVPLVDAE